MQEVIKVFAMLVTISAISKFSDLLYVRRKLHIVACIVFIISVIFFNSSFYFVILLGLLIISYVYSKVVYNLMSKSELAQVEKLKSEINYYKTMCGSYIVKCEDLEKKLNKEVSTQQAYTNALASLVDSMYLKYMNSDVDKSLAEDLEDMKNLLRKPIVLYPNKNTDLFTELHTVKDYDRAIKAIHRFRNTYFFGEGFNTELEFYESTLEEAKKNVSNRVYKK